MKEINNKKGEIKILTKIQEKQKAIKQNNEIWLAYGRVSSHKQVVDGNGLPCQKKRCNEYAKERGYQIQQFFGDEGVSGGTRDRPGLKALFEYINKNKGKEITIVCEDMNRLARDMLVYLSLKLEFERKKVKIFYINQEIDDSPQGRIVEQMFMMIAQFFREENRQRVINRQKSRLEDGFWCHGLPKGYKWSTNKKGGKRLLLDEPNCYIVKEALEKFANYELGNITEVGKYLYERGIRIGGYMSTIMQGYKYQNIGCVSKTICNVLYAGYVNMPEWGINMIKGNHKAIISLETHKKILKRVEEIRIKGGHIKQKLESSENRIDRSRDFPLRGALYFEGTHYMLTGTWVKGRRGKLYPYYIYSKGTSMTCKSIAREDMHLQFENLLKKIQPSEEMITQIQEAIKQKKEENEKNKNLFISVNESSLKIIETKIEKFTERIGNTEDEFLIGNYENKLKKLYQDKEALIDKIEEQKKPLQTTKKIDYELIQNALQVWRNGNLEEKKKLIKNIFPEGIPVNEKKQIQTPNLSLIYQISEVGKNDYNKMLQLIGQNLNQLY